MVARSLAGGIMGLGMIAGMASAQPSPAPEVEPVRVGILDVAAKRVVGVRDGVTLDYREFTADGHAPGRWRTPAGPDHGEMVVSTFVEQYRRLDRRTPIHIYAANAFSMKEKADGTSALSMDFVKAKEALSWMKSNGVKVVVTAFNTNSKVKSDAIMDEADRLGLIVFSAGANVKDSGKVFPAADPRSVSVVDSGPEMALRKDPSISTWIDFAMDGTVVTGSGAERSREIGSSYASAKAGAYGAFIASRMPGADVSAMKTVLKAASRSVSYGPVGSSFVANEMGGHQGDRDIISAVDRGITSPSLRTTPSSAPARAFMDVASMGR